MSAATICQFWLALVSSTILTTWCAAKDSEKALTEWRSSFPALTTVELEEWLFNPPKQFPATGEGWDAAFNARRQKEVLRDYVLAEILQRDKTWSVPLLEKAWSKLRNKSRTAPKADLGGDIEILTALHRARGLADPVKVVIGREVGPLRLPREKLTLSVVVKNVSEDGQPVYLKKTDTEDFDNRFRVVLKDDQGREFKRTFTLRSSYADVDGTLKPGDGWQTNLAVRNYLEIPPAGKYQLQVLFHNRCSLARFESTDSLMVCRSDPIELIIPKTNLQTTEATAAEVRRLVAELDGSAPLKIVAGTYGEWAHSVIAKDSPAGKLLELGAPAVPPLIAAAQDEKLSSAKQAWLLSLLYTLTGENDPRKDLFMLSSYTYVEGPWDDWTSTERKQPARDRAVSGLGSATSSQPIDRVRLQKLASTWQEWLSANCEVQMK
jgi:uncharacterized protein (DUF4415 family)